MHSAGEDYQPMPGPPAAVLRRERPETREKKDAKEEPPAVASGPLGGWPSLREWPEPADEGELLEGGRVRLCGLKEKNGQAGTLVRLTQDGKWKVKMDNNGGTALLKACYLAPAGAGA
mmetsp:Transcript_39365/g.112360  ORF Transcript_39365/g.112360 Transcript_39365/m.112360 type:complete len:118 (-) Transcript_39365:8-361(-)